MKISFFEEYPNAKNLEKLDLINFPTKLYLAEYSIEGYKNYKHQLQKQNKNIKEVIWWPILNFQEGYWLSPFSKRRGLLRVIYKSQDQNIPILWDAELPMLKKSLFLTQFFKHFKNKKFIKAFFNNYKGKVYTAEYMKESKLYKNLCLNFDPKEYGNDKVKMIYSSMSKISKEQIINKIKELKVKYKENIIIGLGVLTTGMEKNEKILSLENLERDLQICKDSDVNEV